MEIWQNVNGLSYHPGNNQYNERNGGLALSFRDKGKEIAIGEYLNSLNDMSRYLDFSAQKKLSGLLSLGVGAGVVDGYPGGPKAYVLPALRIGNDQYEANLRYAPKFKDNPEVWMLNFGYKLK